MNNEESANFSAPDLDSLREKLTIVMGKAPVTDQVLQLNEPRKVTGRCPLLITHIRNGYKTTNVTTTNHRSREMAVSLGQQRTLVTGTKTKPVTGTQHQRRVL
jgi:hypothetical protein